MYYAGVWLGVRNGAFLKIKRGVQISTLITSTVKLEPNYALINNCCSPVALLNGIQNINL